MRQCTFCWAHNVQPQGYGSGSISSRRGAHAQIGRPKLLYISLHVQHTHHIKMLLLNKFLGP